ncbi:hypothetical protein H310_13830 [Aphanomyces invadans]|uniref:Uncharacterized protein n=1 Tax=Aphanomyces invadans TaxID=157072 RepID=A0A024TCJ8_9STRA|nr:hypothetical protein H310_13830 [Aphanomyces invadans]ETV91773.1 hypothetical protein H310_13830 [Aphanomyces invadans]|eukprot:XP_008879699.1 hypothetical protein H310_13830 [Aphanomyces invadans]
MVLTSLVQAAAITQASDMDAATSSNHARVSKMSFMMIYLCLCLGSKFYVSKSSSTGLVTSSEMYDETNLPIFLQAMPPQLTPEDAQRFLALPEATEHPLHAAIRSGSLYMTQLAQETFAEVDVLSKEQRTPLMLAAELGHADILAYLLDQGADVFAEDAAGNTALHAACEAGHVYATYILLTAGADLDLPNNKMQTPDDVAMPHLQDLLYTNGVIGEEVVRAWDRQFKTHGFIVPVAVVSRRRKRYARFFNLAAVVEEQ